MVNDIQLATGQSLTFVYSVPCSFFTVYLGELVVVCPVGDGAEDGGLGGQGQEVIVLGLLVRLLVVPYLGQQIVFS